MDDCVARAILVLVLAVVLEMFYTRSCIRHYLPRPVGGVPVYGVLGQQGRQADMGAMGAVDCFSIRSALVSICCAGLKTYTHASMTLVSVHDGRYVEREANTPGS